MNDLLKQLKETERRSLAYFGKKACLPKPDKKGGK